MVQHHRVRHVHRKKQKTLFDYAVYFFMIATPLFELPQAVAIFQNHSADNVSLATWAFFALASAVWAVYGFRNKVMPLAVTSCLYLVIESVIVGGIIVYS